jgi:hypothetical protein
MYRVRATLLDQNQGRPSFDIRHAAGPTSRYGSRGPSRINSGPRFRACRSAPLATPRIFQREARDTLDDLANIYFRTKQYVDWVRDNLTPTLARMSDLCVRDQPHPTDIRWDPSTADTPPDHAISMGALDSDYSSRDGSATAQSPRTENGTSSRTT